MTATSGMTTPLKMELYSSYWSTHFPPSFLFSFLPSMEPDTGLDAKNTDKNKIGAHTPARQTVSYQIPMLQHDKMLC